jgi:integrase
MSAVQPRLQVVKVERQKERMVGGARTIYQAHMQASFAEGSWADLSQRWLQSLERRGYSGATLMRNYQPSAQRFLDWVETQGVGPERWSQEHLEDFNDYVWALNGLAKASKKTYLRPVQAMLTWGHKYNLLPRKTVLDGLYSREGTDRKVPALTRDQLKVLYGLRLSERNRLVLRVLAETGMRAGELRTIVPEGIHHEQGRWVINVTNERFRLKTKKSRRSVPVFNLPGEKPLGQELLDYAKRLPALTADSGHQVLDLPNQAIFRNTSRAPFNPLSADQVGDIIHDLELSANLPKQPKRIPHIFPHLFRHTLITDLLRGGNDRHDISRWMGTGVDQIEYTYSHLLATDNTDKLDQVGALRR